MRQLLVVFTFLIACTNISKRNDLVVQQLPADMIPIKPDTATIKSYWVTAKPDIFETAYFKGTSVQINDTVRLAFYSVNIGKINLPTGKVVACDPIMSYQQEAFTTQFPTGKFPVQLAIAKVNDNENQLVGFSRILFSDEPVMKWEFALKHGQQPISIFGNSMYSYPVDGGFGQFVDESLFNRMEKFDQSVQTDIMDNLLTELSKQNSQSWQYANTNYKGINIVAFTSGFGDGNYSTYIGYDKNNNPCRLLTDFRLVDWSNK